MYNNSFSQSTRSISASSALTSTFRDSDSLTFTRSAIMENMPYAALAKASARVEPLATSPVSAVCSMSSNLFFEGFIPAPRRLLWCAGGFFLGRAFRSATGCAHHHYGRAGRAEQAVCDAAPHPAADSRTTMRGDHNQVDRVLAGIVV